MTLDAPLGDAGTAPPVPVPVPVSAPKPPVGKKPPSTNVSMMASSKYWMASSS